MKQAEEKKEKEKERKEKEYIMEKRMKAQIITWNMDLLMLLKDEQIKYAKKMMEQKMRRDEKF